MDPLTRVSGAFLTGGMYLDVALGKFKSVCAVKRSLGIPDLCLSARTSTFTRSTAWSSVWGNIEAAVVPSVPIEAWSGKFGCQNLKPQKAVSHFFRLKIFKDPRFDQMSAMLLKTTIQTQLSLSFLRCLKVCAPEPFLKPLPGSWAQGAIDPATKPPKNPRTTTQLRSNFLENLLEAHWIFMFFEIKINWILRHIPEVTIFSTVQQNSAEKQFKSPKSIYPNTPSAMPRFQPADRPPCHATRGRRWPRSRGLGRTRRICSAPQERLLSRVLAAAQSFCSWRHMGRETKKDTYNWWYCTNI